MTLCPTRTPDSPPVPGAVSIPTQADHSRRMHDDLSVGGPGTRRCAATPGVPVRASPVRRRLRAAVARAVPDRRRQPEKCAGSGVALPFSSGCVAGFRRPLAPAIPGRHFQPNSGAQPGRPDPDGGRQGVTAGSRASQPDQLAAVGTGIGETQIRLEGDIAAQAGRGALRADGAHPCLDRGYLQQPPGRRIGYRGPSRGGRPRKLRPAIGSNSQVEEAVKMGHDSGAGW